MIKKTFLIMLILSFIFSITLIAKDDMPDHGSRGKKGRDNTDWEVDRGSEKDTSGSGGFDDCSEDSGGNYDGLIAESLPSDQRIHSLKKEKFFLKDFYFSLSKEDKKGLLKFSLATAALGATFAIIRKGVAVGSAAVGSFLMVLTWTGEVHAEDTKEYYYTVDGLETWFNEEEPDYLLIEHPELIEYFEKVHENLQ